MKQLIIADVKSGINNGISCGHYFSIAQNYIDIYSNVCHVKVAGGPIYTTRFKNDSLITLPYNVKVDDTLLKRVWPILRNCRFLFKTYQSSDNIIVLQQSGTVTAFLGIALYARQLKNIFVIVYDTDTQTSWIKRFIYKLAKKKIAGIICPYKRIGDCFNIPYCTVTDYIYPTTKSINYTDLNTKIYDFCIVGCFRPDKGVVEAIEYLRKYKCKILIAGKSDNDIQTEILRRIANESSYIDLELGYLPEEKYIQYIRNSSYCLLNYKDDYEDRSSGVVLDAIFNGVPIIGRRCKALQFIETDNLGYLYDDIQSFNPNTVLNNFVYAEFQQCIKKYLQKQDVYKNKIIDFLGLKKAIKYDENQDFDNI